MTLRGLPRHKFLFLALVTTFVIDPKLFVAASTAKTYPGKCRINVNRLVISQSSHVWVCKCMDNNGTEKVIGRVEQRLQPFQNTVGYEQAILRCQGHNQLRLITACQRGSKEYQRIASPIIRECLSTELNQTEKEMNQPFSFKTDRCTADFARFLSPRMGGVWVCNCLQRFQTQRSYFVVSGRAAFLTEKSPLGAEKEIDVLEICTKNDEIRIEHTCQNTPGDFQLLSLQMLEVCCKRARVNTVQKFQCKAAVPDDTSFLREPFVE